MRAAVKLRPFHTGRGMRVKLRWPPRSACTYLFIFSSSCTRCACSLSFRDFHLTDLVSSTRICGLCIMFKCLIRKMYRIHEEESFVTIPTSDECVVSTTRVSPPRSAEPLKRLWRSVESVTKSSPDSDRMFSFIVRFNLAQQFLLVARRYDRAAGNRYCVAQRIDTNECRVLCERSFS